MLLLSFSALLVGYVLVDVLERLQWFARYHADLPTALQFYSLWIPVLASRVVPMAVLLATALTVSIFTRHHEVVGMRACGVSVTRAFAPVVLIAGLVAPLYFVLNEVVLPRVNVRVDDFKSYEIKNHTRTRGPLRQMLWWRTQRVYYATELDVQGGEAKELTIYDLGDNGLPVSRIDAPQARYVSNGDWELSNPIRTEISTDGVRQTPAPSRVRLGEGPREIGASAHLSVWELARAIHDAESSGYDVTGSRVDFHLKLAAPLACLLLPAVALLFAMRGPPFPGPALTLLVSGTLGVGYMLLNGVYAALGYGGFLPPGFAGWAMPATLLLLASGFASRTAKTV
jgi:lipopolysaccharide export system permease protein